MAYKKPSIPLKIQLKHISKKWKKYSKVFYVSFSIFIIFIIGFLALKITFLSPENKIKNIIFNPKNINYFDDQWLYSKISSWLENKNIYTLKADSKRLLSKIQNDYPIVKDIKFSNSWDNTYVNLDFFTPTLIFNHQGSYVWVYNWYFFPISSDSEFLSGRSWIILPRYVWELSWSAFYEVPEQILKYQMERIVLNFNPKKIIYLLWGNKTIIQTNEDKYVVFDNFAKSADINVQLEKYWLFLANNNISQKDIKIIDLGSMEDSVIVSTWNYFWTWLDFDDFEISSQSSISSKIFSWENNNSSEDNIQTLTWENFSSSKNSSSSNSQKSNEETA